MEDIKNETPTEVLNKINLHEKKYVEQKNEILILLDDIDEHKKILNEKITQLNRNIEKLNNMEIIYVDLMQELNSR